MSALGQRTLVSLLVDKDAIEVVAQEGLDLECVPSDDLRKVVSFALDYFHKTGRTKAPSQAVLATEFTIDLFNDHEIDFENTEESIEWALDDLKGTKIHKDVATFNKNLALAMSEADTADRVEVASTFASGLVSLVSRLQSKASIVDAREGMSERLDAYEARANDPGAYSGMTFGLGPIDAYTRGIRPGELACFAAGPKFGKSYLLALVALAQWRVGRSSALYTLENSVEMTLDRIACLGTLVNAKRFERGDCEPEEVARVRAFAEELQGSPNPLWILQPEPGQRTVQTMVRDAQMRGADNLFIDQLTFIEVNDERAPRHLQIREVTHDLKTLISTGRDRMPCLLAHQVNRDGVKAADKVGYLEMYHLAEGSEVERTCDWVFGGYRSLAERAMGQAKFQTLASRRADIEHFEMAWNIEHSIIAATGRLDLDLTPAPATEGT